MKVEAVHTIHLPPLEKGGEIRVVKPGGTFTLSEKDEWMLESGAVRKPRTNKPQLDHDQDGSAGGAPKGGNRKKGAAAEPAPEPTGDETTSGETEATVNGGDANDMVG